MPLSRSPLSRDVIPAVHTDTASVVEPTHGSAPLKLGLLADTVTAYHLHSLSHSPNLTPRPRPHLCILQRRLPRHLNIQTLPPPPRLPLHKRLDREVARTRLADRVARTRMQMVSSTLSTAARTFLAETLPLSLCPASSTVSNSAAVRMMQNASASLTSMVFAT